MKTLSELVLLVEDLTERNAHTLSLIAIAHHYRFGKWENILHLIDKIHVENGSMPAELALYRSYIKAEMMNQILKDHGFVPYEKLNKVL